MNNILFSKARSAKMLARSKLARSNNRIRRSKLGKSIRHELFSLRNLQAKREKYAIRTDGQFNKTSDYAVVLHLYHPETWAAIFAPKLTLLARKIDFDLFITMPASNIEYIAAIRQLFPSVNILLVPNKGRDVLPFIKTANLLKAKGYTKVLKIHSKKSVHRDTSSTASAGGGDLWLSNTLDALIPNDEVKLGDLIRQVSKKSTGLVGPMEYYYPFKMYLRYNREMIEELLQSQVDKDFFTAATSKYLDSMGYFGGTMFWVDLDSITDVLGVSQNNFHKEKGQYDRTTAHAFERVVCILPQIKGKTIYGSSAKGLTKIKNGDAVFPGWYYGDVSGGKPQISIVVPVYGDWQSLSVNIRSLTQEVGNSEDISVHYVNDCGPQADELEDKILRSIKGLTNFYYYRNKHNLGFVQTCNRAALEIVNQKDDVLLLNSDTKVTHNFLMEMRKALYSEPIIGAVTSRSNNATIWSVPMTGRLANHKLASYLLYRSVRNRLPEKYITPTIHGFCVLIRREVITKYGLFDEIYGKGYGEENDFAMRLRKNGWKCAVANRSFVFHYESRSFGRDIRNQQIERNEKILIERYPEYRQLVQEYWDSVKEPLK